LAIPLSVWQALQSTVNVSGSAPPQLLVGGMPLGAEEPLELDGTVETSDPELDEGFDALDPLPEVVGVEPAGGALVLPLGAVALACPFDWGLEEHPAAVANPIVLASAIVAE
jgi:hypothetical protein